MNFSASLSSMDAMMRHNELAVALRAISQHEKAEFLQVLRVAPQLVETESNPTSFLRFCNWDATAAARRLTVYWRKRKELFGDARAFLPVLGDYTGNGALGTEEIKVLQTGAYMFMPNDSVERAVLYVDRNMLPPVLPHTAGLRLRAIFWLFQQLSLNENSQTLGFAVLMKGPHRPHTKDGTNVAKRIQELLHEAFPIRLHVIHIVYVRWHGNGLLESVLPVLLAAFSRFFSDKLRVHCCESEKQVLEKLAWHGLSSQSLPRCMGGLQVVADSSTSHLHPSSSSGGLVEPTCAVGGSHLPGQAEFDQSFVASPAGASKPFAGCDNDLRLVDHGDATVSAATGRGPPDGATAVGPVGSPVDSTLIRPTHPVGPEDCNQDTLGVKGNTVFAEEEHATAFDAPFFPQEQQLQQQQALAPPEKQAACSDDVLHDAGNFPFTEMLDATPLDSEGSPFDPTPILSPAMITQASFATSSVNEADPPLASGIPCVEKTPGTHERGVAALNEAISRLPDAEKKAYEEAVRAAPAILKAESDPLMFLGFCEFNVWDAAQRLATYWKYRVQYFGDRAFLPLTQTMGGALREEDLRTLAAGPFFFLPADARNRPVLCCAPSKRPWDASQLSLVRVAMYFFSILCCDCPATRTEGCIVLVFVPPRIAELSKFDENFRQGIEIALDSFPIKNCDTHVISPSSPMANHLPPFAAGILPVLLRAVGRLLVQGRAHFHVGDTREQLERKLASFNLSRAGLQAALDGGISDHDFARWMKNRQLLESRRWAHSRQPIPTLSPGGSVDTDAKTASSSETSRANSEEVNSAMELVPVSEKKDYLKAIEEVPDLVMKESDPIRFLEFENLNALAAAKGLAAYWRIRCDIFGDRAFLPMAQTGEGALDRKDMAVLQTGFLTQLPNNAAGCSVICCDGSRLDKLSPSTQLRIFFYIWSVVSENDLSRTVGYIALYMMTNRSVFDRAARDGLDIVMEAYPVKLKRFHLLGLCPAGTSESEFCQGAAVRDMVKSLDHSAHEKTIVHACGSLADFSIKLEGSGLSKDRLPKVFGGKWGLEDFVKWQELRVRCEWQLPITGHLREVAQSYSIAGPAVPSRRSLNADEERERRRRLNVVHSRRKRLRAQHSVQVLEEQCSTLTCEREELLREGRELEELLKRAKVIVNEE